MVDMTDLVAQGIATLESATPMHYIVAALLLVITATLLSADPTTIISGRGKVKGPGQFVPKPSKGKFGPKDQLLLDMLDTTRHNYVITDPDLADNPIIYSSEAFCKFTRYTKEEIEGRNCRFLQGKDTVPSDVSKIRSAIDNCREANVNLLNYKKDGTTFINQFFITPMRSESGKVIYFIGIQHEVASHAPGQSPDNVGWVYTLGSHE